MNSLLIDAKKIIDLQLTAMAPVEMRCATGQTTLIVPARQTPCPDGRALSLDGTWQVARWPFAEPETRLVAAGLSDTAWETVQQPGKVLYADPEAESVPIANWNRITQTHIDDADGAVIRRRVAIPCEWAGKRIILRFDAIYPAGRIYLNGELLGEQLSGLTPIEFDVTSKVVPGQECLVAVRLLRKHKFLKMDMVRHALEFAGLAQSACFFATEPLMVEDYHLISELKPSFSQGTVAGEILLRNYGTAAEATITVALLDAMGNEVAAHSQALAVPSGGRLTVPVALALDMPALWNDECPNLYTVCIKLYGAPRPVQVYTYRTGFRRFELRPEGPRLNGNFIKFRGVNHLTYHPEHGMHTPREWLRRCLDLMKKANVNCIRTHFTGPRDLAELCDELGLYLMQELPIDWGTNYIHDPEWVGPALTRIEGAVRRDRHHPSVLVWSIGNENMPESTKVAADGWNHLRIYDRFCKQLDPSRPTMFPPPGPANKIKGIFEVRVGDIADTHYSFVLQKEIRETGRLVNPRSWEADMEECTREEALERGWSGVWFSSEYGIINTIPDLLNSPYLSIIDDVQEDLLSGKNSLQVFIDRMAREWGNMRSDPTCLGGAYFPWLCSGSGNNPWGWVRWGEDADWGVVTADLLPKPQFWGLRVAYSPVQFPARAIWEKGADFFEIELENQFNSIDLKECILRTQLNGGGKWMGMARQFRDVKIACAPGAKVKIRVPLWDEGMLTALKDGGFGRCCFHLLRPDGFRVITADTLVFPEVVTKIQDGAMTLGPDAPM
jgi:hypothetical protein